MTKAQVDQWLREQIEQAAEEQKAASWREVQFRDALFALHHPESSEWHDARDLLERLLGEV